MSEAIVANCGIHIDGGDPCELCALARPTIAVDPVVRRNRRTVPSGKEIARRAGLSPARVSQLLAAGVTIAAILGDTYPKRAHGRPRRSGVYSPARAVE